VTKGIVLYKCTYFADVAPLPFFSTLPNLHCIAFQCVPHLTGDPFLIRYMKWHSHEPITLRFPLRTNHDRVCVYFERVQIICLRCIIINPLFATPSDSFMNLTPTTPTSPLCCCH
jgi:hypothetical protein